MAVTSIHSIKTNLSGAIAYIVNGDKTVNGLYVSSYLCRDDSRGAAEDFAKIRQRGTGRATILGYHIIQSFKPDEITPEKALAVSEELCDKFLKGRYQYVLAVHTDHSHLHTHIIFNNINAYNGLSFTYEENQGGRRERAWAKLRQISDEICEEHKLSVIEEPEKNTGISHYERDMQIEGKSWKEKLRHKLAKAIMKSCNFEDFLRRCRKKGIEVVYEPTRKYKIKYRLEGQQRFVRGETLGEYYTADAIAQQIDMIYTALSQKEIAVTTPKTEPVAEPKPTVTAVPKPQPAPSVTTATEPTPKTEPTAAPSERGGVLYNALLEAVRKRGIEPTPTTVAEPTDRAEITAEEFLSGATPQDKPTATVEQIEKPSEKKEVKADPWEKFRAYGYGEEDIKKLKKVGIKSYEQLHNMMYRSGEDLGDTLNHLWDDVMHLDTLVKYMQTRDHLQPIKTASDSKTSWLKSHYDKKHHDELYDYGAAVIYIKEHIDEYKDENGKKPTLKALEAKLDAMKKEWDQLDRVNIAHHAQYSIIRPYITRIRSLEMAEQNKRALEQSRQKTQTRKKNTYLE